MKKRNTNQLSEYFVPLKEVDLFPHPTLLQILLDTITAGECTDLPFSGLPKTADIVYYNSFIQAMEKIRGKHKNGQFFLPYEPEEETGMIYHLYNKPE